MKATEEKGKTRFQIEDVEDFEEFVDDGRVYCACEELQELNTFLQFYSKKGVIIMGDSGVGKAAIVRQFVQQNLEDIFGVDSMKVIRISDIFLEKFNTKQLVEIISEIVETYRSSGIIVYAKFENQSALRAAVKTVECYMDKIRVHYGVSFLKCIFEFSSLEARKRRKGNEDNDDMSAEIAGMSNQFGVILYQMPRDEEDFLNVIVPRIDELSATYHVSYTRKNILFLFCVARGWIDCEKDVDIFMECIEYAFVLTYKEGKDVLERDVARLLFPNVFKYLETTSQDVLRNTAVHESGHCLLELLNDKSSKVRYVSIVPGSDYNGATVFEYQWRKPSCYIDREYMVKSIATDLAGRISENILRGKNNSNTGAASDLDCAMRRINCIITKNGLSKSLGENYVIVGDDKFVSEQTKVKIEEERRQILEEARKYAYDEICKHIEFVNKLATRLLSELVVTKEDIYKMWDEYLKSCN